MTPKRHPFTKEGYHKLKTEWEHLTKVERPKVVKGVSDAAFEGDRSENAEYIYGKKRLREIDKRLQYLGALLKDAVVHTHEDFKGDCVVFGAVVVLKDEKGLEKRWKIVGEAEADTREGTISYVSPVAKAILGKRVGDLVEVELPDRTLEFEIMKINP